MLERVGFERVISMPIVAEAALVTGQRPAEPGDDHESRQAS